jgi:yecA family protein
MSAIDDMALSDEALEAWLAVKTNRRPLVRTVSALDGFVTAAVIGPPFPDPQYWICPAVGLPFDVLANGTALEHAVFASVARVHNRINETFFNRPEEYAPRFVQKADGGIDPQAWCRGFYAAMNLNLRDWKPLLNRGNIHHGLLLPILAYCVDKKGAPVLGRPRPGPDTAQFFENEAYLDIPLVVPAIKELHNPLRSARYA